MAAPVSKMSLTQKERSANKTNPFHISGYLFFSTSLLREEEVLALQNPLRRQAHRTDQGCRSSWECCWAEAKSTAAKQLLCEYCPWAVISWRIKHWVPASYWPSAGLESQTASDYAITIIKRRRLQKLPILMFQLHSGNTPLETWISSLPDIMNLRYIQTQETILAISPVSK